MIEIKTYVKKPVAVQATYFSFYMDAPHITEWINLFGGVATYGQERDGPVEIHIATLEGVMRAQIGDYIIRGTEGEFYPCKSHAFATTFELLPSPVEEGGKDEDGR